MKNDNKSLTKKQNAFVYEYVKDFNGTAAAKRAGYSENRASEIAWQLLQKTTVLEAIDKLNKDIEERLRLRFLQDALKARQVLYDVMVDPNSSNRDKIMAAKDFLDKAGFKAVEKREISGSDVSPIQIMFVEPE